MPTQIPVFVSAPTDLSLKQNKAYKQIIKILDDENFERRALGRSDYPTEYPMKEVLLMARHCSGGLILGFNQFTSVNGISKPNTKKSEKVENIHFPTPWNNLEAGILFGLRLPLMVFQEMGISGGIFDRGVSNVFHHDLPDDGFSDDQLSQLKYAFQNWASSVREHYRKWD